MKTALALLMALALVGCGTLIPKKVELFQDKVKPFPEPTSQARELQRQAAHRAMETSLLTVQAAALEDASTNVVAPAVETQRLTEAVAVSLGPPVKPAVVTSETLATKLETAVAKYNTRVEDFKQDNNVNSGKKIEDTGLIKVPYFLWTGGILLAVMVLFFVGKLVLSAFAMVNPGAAVGLNVVNAAQSVVTKGFSQLVKGGEDFKGWVKQEVEDTKLRDKILDAFRVAHQQAQDGDVQGTIKAVTK